MKTKFLSFLIVISIVCMSACSSNAKKDGDPSISTDVIDVPSTASGKVGDSGTAPVMVFNEEKYDFGKITQGEKVTHAFVFKNMGGSDLIISSAQGSCGCTVPSYPKQAIKSGETSKVDVVFNSDGKSGLTQKTVTLITNCNPSAKVITISTTVIVPEEE